MTKKPFKIISVLATSKGFMAKREAELERLEAVLLNDQIVLQTAAKDDVEAIGSITIDRKSMLEMARRLLDDPIINPDRIIVADHVDLPDNMGFTLVGSDVWITPDKDCERHIHIQENDNMISVDIWGEDDFPLESMEAEK